MNPALPQRLPSSSGIQASLVKVLPDAVSARGIDAEPVWAALQIKPQSVAEHARVPVSNVCEAIHVACSLAGDSSVVLQAALAVRPLHLGNLGYALMSSAQGEDGLKVYERFQTLLCDEMVAHHRISKGLIEVQHDALPGVAIPRDARFWWFLLGARLCFARWVSGRDLTPVRMDIPAPPPPQGAAHAFERLMRCPVRYDTEHCRECLPADWLTWLNPNADAALHDMMRARTAQQLSTQPDADPLLACARITLGEHLAQGHAVTIGAIVDAINGRIDLHDKATARQLQKRLSQQGLTFKDLVEEVRRERALRLLRDTDQSATDIAHACGYTEISPFHRAVKRWTGLTPAQVRQQQR